MIFERVVCGVDATEESLEAVRQAGRLADPSGRLLLVAVAELEVAAQAGFAATMVAEELEQEADEALQKAVAAIASQREAETRLLTGPVPATLLAEVERERATLVCLGTHGHGRASGIVLARASTSLLHDAPCSVLIARRPTSIGSFPSRIVVGVDGSAESQSARAVAEALGERFEASVRRIVATRGKELDVERVVEANPGAEVIEAKPLEALAEAAGDADLLVIGSRGLHGLRALGSVSERVAHQARCSVLAVR